jgi:hypothetical protein
VVVFVDEAAENGLAVDRGNGRPIGNWQRSRWVKLLPAVWPLGVVVTDVRGHDRRQMTSAEDQHAVGQFRSDGADEPFRVAVRLRLSGLQT